jgi:ABC-type transport system involved in multi-copper enzyme maturation permease subunit
MSLLLAELRRMLSRRAVVVLLVAGLVFTALVAGGVAWDGRPISSGDVAAAQEQIDRDIALCEENPRRYGRGPNFECADAMGQPADYIYRQVLTPGAVLESSLLPLTLVLSLLALLIGTTFVGAEWTSGSLSNLLLFEPRRSMVWVAKLLAVAVVVTAFAAVVLGTAVAASLAAAYAWSDVEWTSTRGWDAAYATLRSISVVGAVAVVGVAMTLALRSTMATVGLALGYVLVGEALLRAVAQQSVEKWLLTSHLFAFLQGKVRLVSYEDFARRPDVTVLHLQTSALYLGVLLLVLLVVSLLTFRRRDIA